MLLENDERFDASGEILLALEEIRASLEHLAQAMQPSPQPNFDQYRAQQAELIREFQAEMVNTVNSLRPGIDSEEVAEAFARKIAPPQSKEQELSLLVDAINDLKKSLDFRLRGIGQSFGGGATLKTDNLSVSSDVSDRTTRELGRVTGSVAITNADLSQEATLIQVRDFLDTIETRLQSLIDKDYATQATLATRASESTLATRASETTLSSLDSKDFATQATLASRSSEATLLDVKRGLTDYEARLDYDGSNNLIYSGKAPNGTASSANTWTIQKLTYTGSNLTRVQVLIGAWDNRAALAW